jgi:hypothetical protein
LPRDRRRACGGNFTAAMPRRKPAAVKALAALSHAMGKMSFRGIARLLNGGDGAVLKWIRHAARKQPEPEMPAAAGLARLGEMRHFLKKRQKSHGFGERLILSGGEPYPGFWAGVMMQAGKSSSPKPESKAARS